MVSMQNAVAARHLMGVATGAMNFFRSLGAALVVAVFGAIVLGGIGGSGVSVEMLARHATDADLAHAFRFVFLTAALALAFGLAFLIGMEQKPLRSGPAG
jgi:hypothetical protein